MTPGETVIYRVVILDSDHSSLLVIRTAVGVTLPRLEIPRSSRTTARIRELARTLWNVHLFVVDLAIGNPTSAGLVVAEQLTVGMNSYLAAAALNHLPPTELNEEERSTIQSLIDGTTEHPFLRVGWIYEGIRWVEQEAGCHVSDVSQVEQYNSGGPFSLIRFRADDGARYWFKATGEPNTQEFPITCLLSKACGTYLPTLVGVKPEWNAWLMSDEGFDASLDTRTDSLEFLDNVVCSMAALQVATIDIGDSLVRAGAFATGSQTILRHIDDLFAYVKEAMSRQTSTRVPPIADKRLNQISEIAVRICEHLARLDIPSCAVHGDLSRGNILRGEADCRFIDWAETHVALPLISCEHLLLFDTEVDSSQRAANAHFLRAKYRNVMEKVCDPLALDRASPYMSFFAALFTLYGRGHWFTKPGAADPRRHAYSRTLARYLDRAASEPSLLLAIGI